VRGCGRARRGRGGDRALVLRLNGRRALRSLRGPFVRFARGRGCFRRSRCRLNEERFLGILLRVRIGVRVPGKGAATGRGRPCGGTAARARLATARSSAGASGVAGLRLRDHAGEKRSA